MRELTQAESAGLITGWKCAACDWFFHLDRPCEPESLDDGMRKLVQKLFEAHECRPSSKG